MLSTMGGGHLFSLEILRFGVWVITLLVLLVSYDEVVTSDGVDCESTSSSLIMRMSFVLSTTSLLTNFNDSLTDSSITLSPITSI